MGSNCQGCSDFLRGTGGIVIGSAVEPEPLALPVVRQKPAADKFIANLYNIAEKSGFSQKHYSQTVYEKMQRLYGYAGANTHDAVSRWMIDNFDFGE
jgi:coenzyme F420-reducing hydrogenase beta subunit